MCQTIHSESGKGSPLGIPCQCKYSSLNLTLRSLLAFLLSHCCVDPFQVLTLFSVQETGMELICVAKAQNAYFT